MRMDEDFAYDFVEMSSIGAHLQRLKSDSNHMNSMGRNSEQKPVSPRHLKLTQRLEKSLYYGKLPGTDRPSLPMTEIVVEYFQYCAPREFGRIDTSYAAFVSRRACISPCSMVLGMIYIERLRHNNVEYLCQTSSSDLFLISMMMASKFLYDSGSDDEVFNDEWAQSANMDIEDLNRLERSFLKAIDWDLFVRAHEFWDMLKRIEKRIAWQQANERGWFSYTDLSILTDDIQPLTQLYDCCLEMIQMLVVMVLAYVASIVTMLGSTAMVISAQAQLSLLQDLLVKQRNLGGELTGVSSQLEIVPPFHLHRDHHIVDMCQSDALAENPVLETFADQSAVRIQERILGASLPNGVPILNSLTSLRKTEMNVFSKESKMDYECREGTCSDRVSGLMDCMNISAVRCRNPEMITLPCLQCSESRRTPGIRCCCRPRHADLYVPKVDLRFGDFVVDFRRNSIIRT